MSSASTVSLHAPKCSIYASYKSCESSWWLKHSRTTVPARVYLSRPPHITPVPSFCFRCSKESRPGLLAAALLWTSGATWSFWAAAILVCFSCSFLVVFLVPLISRRDGGGALRRTQEWPACSVPWSSFEMMLVLGAEDRVAVLPQTEDRVGVLLPLRESCSCAACCRRSCSRARVVVRWGRRLLHHENLHDVQGCHRKSKSGEPPSSTTDDSSVPAVTLSIISSSPSPALLHHQRPESPVRPWSAPPAHPVHTGSSWPSGHVRVYNSN